jgi:hypothetical protein
MDKVYGVLLEIIHSTLANDPEVKPVIRIRSSMWGLWLLGTLTA